MGLPQTHVAQTRQTRTPAHGSAAHPGLQPLLTTNVQMRGNGVFSYGYAYHPADPDSTWWILDFYEHAHFLGQTVPPVKNI